MAPRNPPPSFRPVVGAWLLALLWIAMPAARAAEPLAGIHVTGAGEVQVVPDMARVTLEARRQGEDAAALKEELDDVVGKVLTLARELGIEDRHVTAAGVTIHPHYRHMGGESKVDGLVAIRSIEVTLEDLDLLGQLINGALERGVNGVAGVQLDASNRVALERQALDRAIDDAIREADQIARRFGVSRGPVRDVQAGNHQVQPLMMEQAMVQSARGGDIPMAPGEMTIRRTVQATFAIGQGQRGAAGPGDGEGDGEGDGDA